MVSQTVQTIMKSLMVTDALLKDQGEEGVRDLIANSLLHEVEKLDYRPIGKVETKIVLPDPAAPVPEQWEHLTYDQLPRQVVASVKAVERDH